MRKIIYLILLSCCVLLQVKYVKNEEKNVRNFDLTQTIDFDDLGGPIVNGPIKSV